MIHNPTASRVTKRRSATNHVRLGLAVAVTGLALARVPVAFASSPWEAAPSCHGQVGEAGLSVKDGHVVTAALLGEIHGYARMAGVSGGLGGQLRTVTTDADYNKGEPPIAGSLRAIMEQAIRANMPVWITFGPDLPRPTTITLKRPLHLGNNMTVDGSCADVTIESDPKTGLFYVIGRHNVVIDRLRFHKTNYVSGMPNASLGTAVRLGGAFDAVAVLHNDLSECGDGCIDTTSGKGKPVPDVARVTIAFNYLHDHDKTMLFGTYNCPAGDDCDAAAAAENARLGPGLFMTMEGNLLMRVAQRNPRVFGRAILHAFNNYIAFQPHARPGGGRSASYGIFVSNGARALVEHNRFVSLDSAKQLAIWTSGMPGAKKELSGDLPGFIRLAGRGQAGPEAIAAENVAGNVPAPPYTYDALPIEALLPDRALACVGSRAGRDGVAQWSDAACDKSHASGLTP